MNGNGTYTTTLSAIPIQAGTWQWTAQYSGDADNQPVSTACGAEPVVIGPSVEDQITDLIALIESFNLQPSHANSLISKLEAVLADPNLASAVASRVWWKREVAHSSGWVKCTTSRPPWQAATGGTRHGKGYQAGRSA